MIVGYTGTVGGLLATVAQGLLGGTWTWEFETRQADRRRAVLEQLVDKLADDQGLSDGEYVRARKIALERAEERLGEPVLVTAAWAVSLAAEARKSA